MTASYFTEDLPWPTFIAVCSKEMDLREGSVPEFSWKFSNGSGSKTWTTLSESSYYRMMVDAAKRIRARAKKESDLKDADLGSGWRIDLKLENKVEVNRKVSTSDKDTEKEKKKKKKKKSKGKMPAKRKRGRQNKVPDLPIRILLQLISVDIFSHEKSKGVAAS